MPSRPHLKKSDHNGGPLSAEAQAEALQDPNLQRLLRDTQFLHRSGLKYLPGFHGVFEMYDAACLTAAETIDPVQRHTIIASTREKARKAARQHLKFWAADAAVLHGILAVTGLTWWLCIPLVVCAFYLAILALFR